MALQDHATRPRNRLLRRWFDKHITTVLTVAVCAIAVGIVAFGASQIFAAHEQKAKRVFANTFRSIRCRCSSTMSKRSRSRR